jgi:hypothetical protein
MDLHRVATHEAGHAIAAHVLRLLVREVLIRDDGSGHVAYYPVPVSAANIARRAVTMFARPAAERAACGDARAAGDVTRLRDMLDGLRLDWAAGELERHRCGAVALVRRERAAVTAVANELERHRRLTGFEIADIVGRRSIFQVVA